MTNFKAQTHPRFISILALWLLFFYTANLVVVSAGKAGNNKKPKKSNINGKSNKKDSVLSKLNAKSIEIQKGNEIWSNIKNLPQDIRETIFDCAAKDHKTLLSINLATKEAKQIAQNSVCSVNSIMGGKGQFINDKKFCKTVAKNPEILKQIRQLWISWDTYQYCQFSPSKLYNLRQLYIKINKKRKPRSGQVAPLGNHSNNDNNKRHADNSKDSTPLSKEYQFENEFIRTWMILNQEYKNLNSLDVFDKQHASVLIHLLLDGRIEDRLKHVKYVLDTKRVDINFQGLYLFVPLDFCLIPDILMLPKNSHVNTLDCLNLLLDYGADPNIINSIGKHSPIHLAAKLVEPEPIELLLNRGADINLRYVRRTSLLFDSDGPTAIHVAIEGKKLTHANSLMRRYRDLILHKIDGRKKMEDTWKPIYAHNLAIKRLPFHVLIERGADLKLLFYNESPLMIAIEKSKAGGLAMEMLNLDPSRLLLTGDPQNKIAAPLYAACKNGNVRLAKKLLEIGVNIDEQTYSGETAMFAAITSNNVLKLTKILLEAGANVDVSTKRGATCITAAFTGDKIYLDVALWILKKNPQVTDTFTHKCLTNDQIETKTIGIFVIEKLIERVKYINFDKAKKVVKKILLLMAKQGMSLEQTSIFEYRSLLIKLRAFNDQEIYFLFAAMLPGEVRLLLKPHLK